MRYGRTRRTIGSSGWALGTALAVLIVLAFSVGADDVSADDQDNGHWALIDTQINPNGDSAPDRWDVTTTESSMTVVQSFGPEDTSGAEAVFDASWTPPPAVLEPGAPFVIPVTVSGRNTGNLETQYFFGLDVIMIVNDGWNREAVGAGSSCAQTTVISGVYECSEPVTNSGEMLTNVANFGESYSVGVSALNCGGACWVSWTYEFVPAEPTATTSAEEPTGGIDSVPDDAEWGVIEEDGVLKLIPPPDGGVLSISRSDLPEWARGQIVTAGAMVVNVGPPDSVLQGDPRVLVDGAPIARVGDGTSHGGVIVAGSNRILVNGKPAAVVGSFAVCPMVTGLVPHVGGPIATLGSEEAYLSLIDPVFRSSALTVRAVEKFEAYLEKWGTGPNEMTFAVRQLGEDLQFARLETDSLTGDTRIEGDFEGYEPGDGVLIGGEQPDIGVVADKGSIILDQPLVHDHAAGSPIIRVDAELIVEARRAANGTGSGLPVALVAIAVVVVLALIAGVRSRPARARG